MDATRPGGRKNHAGLRKTQRSEVAIDPAAICMDEKDPNGSYIVASVDLQE